MILFTFFHLTFEGSKCIIISLRLNHNISSLMIIYGSLLITFYNKTTFWEEVVRKNWFKYKYKPPCLYLCLSKSVIHTVPVRLLIYWLRSVHSWTKSHSTECIRYLDLTLTAKWWFLCPLWPLLKWVAFFWGSWVNLKNWPEPKIKQSNQVTHA